MTHICKIMCFKAWARTPDIFSEFRERWEGWATIPTPRLLQLFSVFTIHQLSNTNTCHSILAPHLTSSRRSRSPPTLRLAWPPISTRTPRIRVAIFAIGRTSTQTCYSAVPQRCRRPRAWQLRLWPQPLQRQRQAWLRPRRRQRQRLHRWDGASASAVGVGVGVQQVHWCGWI